MFRAALQMPLSWDMELMMSNYLQLPTVSPTRHGGSMRGLPLNRCWHQPTHPVSSPASQSDE
jgi:hypothetical protein